MGIRIAEIAKITGAVIEGNADIEISLPGKLEEADNQTLCFFANPKYEAQLYASKAAAVIVPFDFKPAQPVTFALIRHANPYFAFCMVLNAWFNPNEPKNGIEIGS
ncbi:MAG: LpxD N-terminal domain-containing protein, partial [Sphingomonadales bacterium]